MRRAPLLLPLLALLSCGPGAAAQQPLDAGSLRARVAAEGRVRLASSGLVIERYDFAASGAAVEAVVTRADAPGRRPAILLVPGYSRTAYDMLPVAVRLARAGFATLAVSQPGFGGSAGPADFAGPRTNAAHPAAAQRVAADP
jgi:pimeloyl-ACP methyl ester carboxylesterase